MSPWISARFLRSQSDERLVAAARQGHGRAFEALVRRHRPALLGYARQLLGEARAEDAVQQALLQAWTALQRGDRVSNPRAWLYRVVHNAAVDASRRSARHEHAGAARFVGVAASASADIELRAQVEETLVGLAALPPVQREALVRTALAGDSHERVAASLGVSTDAVRGLVHRARARLRAAAGALAPPLVSWAAIERRAAALLQRLGGVGPGRGYDALTACGAAAIATGALAAGTVAVHRDHTARGSRAHAGAALVRHAPTSSATVRETQATSPIRGGGGAETQPDARVGERPSETRHARRVSPHARVLEHPRSPPEPLESKLAVENREAQDAYGGEHEGEHHGTSPRGDAVSQAGDSHGAHEDGEVSLAASAPEESGAGRGQVGEADSRRAAPTSEDAGRERREAGATTEAGAATEAGATTHREED